LPSLFTLAGLVDLTLCTIALFVALVDGLLACGDLLIVFSGFLLFLGLFA
jgi:hypothetical protein